MRRILVVGGGYAGFYTAWRLEKKLRRGEAEVIVVDPRPYMTYQPFLPEVVAGSVEARHAAVSLRRNLQHTRVVAGMVTGITHADKTVTIHPAEGPEYQLAYDVIAVTAGAVTRTFAVPGVADRAIGMKHVEEAVAIRDRLLTAFDEAAVLEPGPQRRKLLTVTFVGGGFSGVEGFAELLSLAAALPKRYPELSENDLAFHLVEATGRILPEVTDGPASGWCRCSRSAARLVHLNTFMQSADDGHVVLSDGAEFDSELIVWTAGNAATPLLRNHTDLPHQRARAGRGAGRPAGRHRDRGDPGRVGGRRRRGRARPGGARAGRVHGAERAARRTARANCWRRTCCGQLRGRRAEELRAQQPRRGRDARPRNRASSSTRGSSSRACWPG